VVAPRGIQYPTLPPLHPLPEANAAQTASLATRERELSEWRAQIQAAADDLNEAKPRVALHSGDKWGFNTWWRRGLVGARREVTPTSIT
jgi:hypothetical protein